MEDDRTIEQLMQRLAQPMNHQWRVKMFYPKGKAGDLEPGTKGQFIPYIDSRDVYDRLDEVLGADKWSDEWHVIDTVAHAVKVTLKVDLNGTIVTKSDVGYPNSNNDEEPYKSAVSSGIKRAAVHFGIGRYLYNLDPIWAEVDKWGKPLNQLTVEGEVKPSKTSAAKPARSRSATKPAPTTKPTPCEIPDCTNTIEDVVGNKAYHDGHAICRDHSQDKETPWRSLHPDYQTEPTISAQQEDELLNTAINDLGGEIVS